MFLHELLEESPAPFLVFRDFPSRWRYRNSADVAHCEGSGDINSQGKSFDVAVKLPRQSERGLQGRAQKFMLFDRNENGSEAHGDLHSSELRRLMRWTRPGTSRRLAQTRE